jgi:hypothetical protein
MRVTDGLVFLSAPAAGDVIGPTTLTTVDAAGTVRSVVLDRILTGFVEPDASDGSNPLGSHREAGLAIDAGGNHAFVVGAGEPIAEVELATLAVTYHGGSRTLAKALDGRVREAAWLPNGMIAVTGYDGRVSTDVQGNLSESETPAGLTLVDTRTWTARTVDAAASSFAVSGDLLVSYCWFAGAGLGFYGLDGSARFRAFQGPVQDVQLGAGMAYVGVSVEHGWRLEIVDTASGQVVNSVSGANFAVVSG